MNMTISRKLGALIGVSVLVSVVAMSLQLYALHQTIWKDRQSLIVSQVDSAITMLAGFQARVEAGELSLEEAQNRAREAARPIRFGNNDYLFMMSADGMRVMHPDPKLQGTDAFTSKDSKGTYYNREMVENLLPYTARRVGRRLHQALLCSIVQSLGLDCRCGSLRR